MQPSDKTRSTVCAFKSGACAWVLSSRHRVLSSIAKASCEGISTGKCTKCDCGAE